MASTFNDILISGRATQLLQAQNPNDLVPLSQVQSILQSLFQGNWNASAIYTAGMMTNDAGSLYQSNQTNQNKRPSLNPTQWRLLVEGGEDSFLYVAYASASDGTGFSLTPGAGLNYLAVLSSPTELTSPGASDFEDLWMLVGTPSYLYLAYASASDGTGFSLTPGSGLNYIGILNSPTAITAPAAGNFTGLWKFIGQSGYLYLAYASDASGTGFSLTPGSGLNYIGILNSATAITSLSGSNFTGLWTLMQGPQGTAGQPAYVYVAYASDTSGTGFSLTPGAGLTYCAIKATTTAIGSPGASDFTGLWRLTGPNNYIYIAYASAADGTGFSLTPSNSLNYIAILNSATPITSPASGNFTGLWKLYGSPLVSVAGGSPLTLSSGTLGINAASANTASYVVQRDGSGNFAAGQITATSLVVGSATISWSTALSINQAVVVNGLTVGSLGGVLKASSGVVAGSATTSDLTEGTNLYFSAARVVNTVLAGLSSPVVLTTSDTILTAMGKIDAFMGDGFVPLAGGSGAEMTGALYFTDGISNFLQLGNRWTQNATSANAKYNFNYNGSAWLTLDQGNNLITAGASVYYNTPVGYKLNGNQILYLQGGANAIDFGGNFQIYTQSSATILTLVYNGGTALKIDTSANVTVQNTLYMNSHKVIDTNNYYWDKNGHQILSTQQSVALTGTTVASGWTDTAAMGDFNHLIAAMVAHGLISV